jgi:hypothetical protein
VTVGLAAALVAISFVTGGGVDETVASPGNTWTEIVLTLLGVLAVSGGALVRLPGARRYGWVTAGLMALMFALEAASIVWSVAPDSSWLASGQMLAYVAVFAGAIVLARPLARGWATLLGALVLWAVALCAWSLLVKVFPATLAPGNEVGRLQAPLGYWNAIALSAAMGLPCCLWLAARRDGGRRLAALAAPGIALLVAVLVLSSSRSADLAAAVAAGLWLVVVPLRLRAVAMLVLGAAGGAVISAWALIHHALSHNDVSMAAQDHAGHAFGFVILGVLVFTGIGGIALADSMDRARVAARTRGRIGAGALGALGLGVVLAVVAVAASSRGLEGEISHGWQQLTNPQGGSVSASSATRVLQFGSSRPLYWHEALAVGDHNVLKGVGEVGFSVAHLRWATDPTEVMQAHSYVFETYADLGILGLAVTAALLAAWLAATGRAIGPRRRWRDLDPSQRAEHTGLVTLAALVVGFGVQSTLDWTWYFTGLAVPVLIAAGWLAGRGPALDSAASTSDSAGAERVAALDRPGALAVAILLCAAALLGSWMVWRPLHSAHLVNAAENTGSLDDARAAQSADPLSLEPYEVLSALYLDSHRPTLARSELERATRVQPVNPLAWTQLADFLVARRAWRASILPLHNVQVYDTTTDGLAVHNGAEIGKALPHVTGQ